MQRTKIVCTLGPASESPEMIERLMISGMNVARINFSHGSEAEQRSLFKRVREASGRKGDVAILCDIQGPKIRTGRMKAPFLLKQGDKVVVTSRDIPGTAERFTIDYPRLEMDLDQGDQIFINDGIVRLRVSGRVGGGLECEVKTGGLVSDRKGCNIPSSNLSMAMPTKKDLRDIRTIAKLDPEYVAASFIGSKKDMLSVKEALRDNGNDGIKVISKIERPLALTNIEGILAVSDGLMVARGDLGVEIPPHEVPAAQKMLCLLSNKAGIPVIVATQMLESMVEHSRPTRAEASDVFNAVLDGADAVMLSGETSLGKHPEESVRTMKEIVMSAERHFPRRDPDRLDSRSDSMVEKMGHACYGLVTEFNDSGMEGAIIAVTRRGHSARMISKYRPDMDIIAVTPSRRTARELALVWGVTSLHSPEIRGKGLEGKLVKAVELAHSRGFLSKKSHVITAMGSERAPGDGIFLGAYDLKGITGERR